MFEIDDLQIQWILILAILVTTLILYTKRSFSYWKKKNVPYIKSTFPFGNFENIFTSDRSQPVQVKDLYDKFKKQGARYCGLYFFTVPIFVPIDLNHVRDVLVKDFSSFHERGMFNDEKGQPMSANLFTIDGPKWRMMRARYSSAFSSGKIKSMFNTLNISAEPMYNRIAKCAKSKTPINTKDITGRYTIDNISSCAFGVESNSFKEDRPEALTQSSIMVDKSSNNIRNIILMMFPRIAKLLKIGMFPYSGMTYFGDMIVESLVHRESNGFKRNDFLQILKDMKDSAAFDMSVETIQAQSFVFFMAGYETVSSTLMYSLYELARNVDIQHKLRDEIQNALKEHGDVTYDAVNEMKYLQCVIDEVLRMYPSLGLLNRKCAEDYTIPGTDTVLEKGTNILIPVRAIHRDPQYFPNPDVFDPSRFSGANKQNIPPYAYLPFGDGPRNCIGKRFGLLEVAVGLIHLIRNFTFTLNEKMKYDLQYTSHFVLTPNENILLDVEEVYPHNYS